MKKTLFLLLGFSLVLSSFTFQNSIDDVINAMKSGNAVNQIKGFDVKHKGNNDNGDYCIGTLQTKNGNYRTTVYMRMKGNKQIIQDIRIQ